MEMGLTLTDLTRIMLKRVAGWMPDFALPDYAPPPLPEGLILPARKALVLCSHCCEREPVVTLPIALIVPGLYVHFESPENWYYCVDKRFTVPYWVGPITVLHDGAPPQDRSAFRPLTAAENISVLCQYSSIGSLRSVSGIWNAQVFHQKGRVVGSVKGSGPGHHVAWGPVGQVKDPVEYLHQEVRTTP